MQSAWKVIGGVIILFAVIIAVFSYEDVIPFFFDSPSQRLESLWERDITLLAREKSLHEGFFQIRDIQVTFGSEQAKKWFKDLRVPIVKKPSGKYRLDLFVDDWKEGHDYGVVIQYQLVDLATQDTVWELGRTLTLGQNEQNPSQNKKE